MRLALAIALALIAGAAFGCGDDEEESSSSPVEASELTITLAPKGPGGGAPQEALVQCPGAAAPPAVCQALDELSAADAAPVPPQTPCTEIYGGPDVVTIEGTIEGEEVDAELTRANGCEIERFDRFAPLLEALFPGYKPGGSLAP